MKKLASLVGCIVVSFVAIAVGCFANPIDFTCAGKDMCPVPDGGLDDGGPLSEAGLVDGTVVGPDGAVCDPRQVPSANPCVINNALAIFVAPSGSDTNPGTKEQPVLTIGHGLTLAHTTSTHRVIACANPYAESISLAAPADDVGLALFGGVLCPGSDAGTAWTYKGAQAVVKAPGPGPALQATGLTKPIVVQDIELDGPTVTAPGGSSIGAFVSGVASAGFTNVKLVAQNATNGVDGTTADNYADGGVLKGNNASDDGGVPGAAQKCTCQDGTSSTGGTGGSSTVSPGPVFPGPGLPPWDGGGGAAGVNGQTCPAGAVSGGANAPAAAPDGGAPTTGTLGASGWTPGNGASGNDGPPGQGGGGGGDGPPPPGAGGGGACGGCGGAGGTGGQAGGSSVALFAYQSAITMTKCQLVAAKAGAGGNGANGQAGQAGNKLGGSQSSAGGCQGGAGGNGAGGNGGGGGAGGISAGVAYSGTPPTIDGNSTTAATTLSNVTLGNAGNAGAGGPGGAAATGSTNAGSAGVLGAAGTSQAVVQATH